MALPQLLALRFVRNPNQSERPSKVVGNRAGTKVSKVKGRGVDFAEVRDYQPGDDIRSIDWNVTARKNKPHTKVLREERERPTLIVVDQTQSMFFGSKVRLKSVAAAEVGARIAWQTLALGDRVGGVVIANEGTHVHRPYRTTKSVARLLNDIATSNQALSRFTSPQTEMQDGLLQVRRLSTTNYRIFVVSDFAGNLDMWKDNLHKLARHNQVTAIHVHDPLEQVMPPNDHYLVTNGRDKLQFYTGDRSLRARYQERFTTHQENITKLCRHDSMRYLSVTTSNTQLDQIDWL